MTRFVTFALAALVLAMPATAADPKFDAEACAKAVAPYLDDQTVAVLHVDLTALDIENLLAKMAFLEGHPGNYPKDPLNPVKALTSAGARDLYVVVSLADVPERPPFGVIPLEKDANVKDILAELKRGHSFDLPHFEQIGDALVGGAPATLKRLQAVKPDARPDLAKAFAAADGELAQLAVIPPKGAAKIIEGAMPMLPAEVGGGSSKVLTQGFLWAAVGLNAPKLKLNAVVQASDADAAKALLNLHDKVFAALGKSKEAREMLPNFDKLTPSVAPKVVGDRLTLTLTDPLLTAILQPLMTKGQKDAEAASQSANLRQLALAAHNYEAAHGAFPANATYDKKGKALLSWRVHLLPYLGEDKLYKEFHLDEPWDSDHNKTLITRMPAVFRSLPVSTLLAEGKTTYLAPVGDETMFPPGLGIPIRAVADGTANTILFVDADADYATVWTKPQDLEYDAKEPWKGFGFRYSGGAVVVFADGSAHQIPKTISKETLRALFTRAGAEVLGADFHP